MKRRKWLKYNNKRTSYAPGRKPIPSLAQRRRDAVTRRLDAVYGKPERDSNLDPILLQLQADSLDPSDWIG